MNLPNYFMADLPPEATFSPSMIEEACLTLKRNREQYLAGRTTRSLIALLSKVGESWLDPEFAFRKAALEQGVATAGFSPETLRKGLDDFFGQLTPENFESLLVQDLGDVERLDGFCTAPSEAKPSRRVALARGPELLAHITAGNLPISTLNSMVLGLLLRSAQFVKCANSATLLPRLFAHSIYEADPKLGACIELAAWRGGNAPLEDALFTAADCVTASGTDETLHAILKRLPAKARFLGYGHRVSFGFVSSEMLSGLPLKETIQRACDDVVAWNQLGCLSPHVIYVQDGGLISPEKFGEVLAESMASREPAEPRGSVPPEIAAAIASRRAIYEVRAAHSAGTRHWCSKGSTAWTVVYESEPHFQLSCLHRFIYVKGVKHLTEALQAADKVRGKVSTVGVAASKNKTSELAMELARWGVPRVCPLGSMQKPPLLWRHDGRPALADLVTWTDWEML